MKKVQEKRFPTDLGAWAFAVAFAISSINPALAKHDHEEIQEAVEEEMQPQPPSIDLEYISPLLKYKRYAEVRGPGWRESNDKVGEIGGWRVYAREAFESEKEPEPDESEDQGDMSGEEK